ncbi:unnamed protein product [Ambrosiozyma monospora]|uniref:Unnamed protein product n=1 Tax=Ambrosiozyma monospora TaxID=43982 RepID=A0A9W6Z870_AMBMO|nr:unnamed protein product [Ambrosiozyma monospora]
MSSDRPINNPDSDSDDDDAIIGYTKDNGNDESITQDESNMIPTKEIKISFSELAPQFTNSQPASRSGSTSFINNNITLITNSKFKPDDDNLIYGKEYVIVGLKIGELLMVKGQYSLTIQRGAVQVDSVTFHSDPENSIHINAAGIASLPLISATQVTDREAANDTKNSENEHLFSPDYKSVVKITNLFNGLETIGNLFPPLKNIYPNWTTSEEDTAQLDEFEKSFFGYSFKIVLNKSENLGTMVLKNWKNQLDSLCREFEEHCATDKQARILVIGPKNCA